MRCNFRDSPVRVGIFFSGVGGPLKAPCRIFCRRCSVSSVMSLKLRAPRRCIFCRNAGSSQEHVFPDWLRHLFPRTAADSHMRRTTTWGKAKSGILYAMPDTKLHQGHSGSRKLKVVCTACNTGWMSRMETRTRPILMRLIQGISHRLSTFDQAILASWVAKTIMVAEFAYPNAIAISDEERLRMYASTEILDHWTIWIADYKGVSWRNLAMAHHICALAPGLSSEPLNPEMVAPPDTQFTSIGMGHLFIQAVSTSTRVKFGLNDDTVSDLKQIWPRTGRDIQWPPLGFLTDAMADYVAASLGRITGLPDPFPKSRPLPRFD